MSILTNTVPLRAAVAAISLVFSQFTFGTSIPEERLQARDLDGNPSTVEAFYDRVLDITWLKDSNIGLSNTFGFERAYIIPYQQRINDRGQIGQPMINEFLGVMNQGAYLGYSGWRIPVMLIDDDPCLISGSIGWTGCTAAEVGSLNEYIHDTYGNVDNSPFDNISTAWSWIRLSAGNLNSAHFYNFGEEGSIHICTGCRPEAGGTIWPVHDGDIGTPASTECIDSDGDGWGWNGYQSCRLSLPQASECIDTDPANDGWGWNGIESCRVAPAELICVDSAPVGDGWGWNGIESCTVRSTFHSQESLEVFLSGADYRSLELLEAGPTPTGFGLGHWFIKFEDGVARWSHSDIGGERGTVTYIDNQSFRLDFSGLSYVAKVNGDQLVFGGVEYRRL